MEVDESVNGEGEGGFKVVSGVGSNGDDRQLAPEWAVVPYSGWAEQPKAESEGEKESEDARERDSDDGGRMVMVVGKHRWLTGDRPCRPA